MENVLIIAEHDLSMSGGIQSGIMNNTARLKKDYHFDIVLFSKAISPNDSVFESYGSIFRIPVDKYNNRILKRIENLTRFFRVFCGVYHILGKKKYTVIHVHDINKGTPALLAGKLRGVPIRIAQCHNPKSREYVPALTIKYIEFLRILLNKCANCKTGSSVEANEYMFHNSKGKCYVINVEMNVSVFKRTNSMHNGVNFIHIGRFVEQKNHLFLLKCFSVIHKNIPETTLSLIGYGPNETSIKQTVSDLELEECVKFYPYDTDKVSILDQSDYMIFPSLYEGFGRVLIEAQAMEVMCYASDVIPKTTDLGLCTYISLLEPPEYWANVILNDIKSQAKLSRKLNYKSLMQFDADNVAKVYAKAYRGEMLCQTNT